MAQKVRIGAVAYLNTRPLVFGMEQGLGADRIELSYAVPARLAEQMHEGRLDVALLPIIALADMPELQLIPGLGIVTRGPSRSVLLISRKPIEAVQSVALDAESRTSNALLRVLFEKAWKRRPEFSMGHGGTAELLERCDAVLRIGDKALFEPLADGARVYDLGQVWTELTGLPFVFAAWIARPGTVDREIYRVLHESRRRGSRAIEQIAADYRWNDHHDPATSREYLEHYIRNGLGSAEISAMRLFFGLAAECGVIDGVPEIQLAFGQDSECHDRLARRREQRPPKEEAGHA